MSQEHKYPSNYYSIEDILATQERVQCKFLHDVPKLGKLDPSEESEDIKAGTVVELPVWLAENVSSGVHPIVSVDLPKIYKSAYHEILKADPCAVNLHKLELYFYELGMHVRQFSQHGEITEMLVNTFKHRFRQIMDFANNSASTEGELSVTDHFDSLERRLFNEGQKAAGKLNTWLLKSHMPMGAADAVINYKKRKRGLEDSQL